MSSPPPDVTRSVPPPRPAKPLDSAFLETLGEVAGTIEFSSVDGPGNRFVVFLQGCNLNCLFCHNPQTIPRRGGRTTSVDDLLTKIRLAAPFLSGVTVSGGEATQQPEFLRDLFVALAGDPATRHLTRFIDTNGDAYPEVWDYLEPVYDGAMVDLKAIDNDLHRRLTGHGNERILRSIRLLAQRGRLHEVRLILAAGTNDSDEILRSTGEWLASVDPRMRIKVNTYRHHGVRRAARGLVSPSDEDRERYSVRLSAIADFRIQVV